MIEKLPENKDKVFKTETGEYLTIPELSIPKPVSNKINELVDVVNQLVLCEQARTCHELIHKNEEPVDTYAEQRKWIGKVCKFWDNLDTNYSLAILVKIIEKEPMPFEDYRGNQWYHCEPVKPDDDIIYRGE